MGEPWVRQKELKKEDIPSKEEFKEMILEIPDESVKALVAILYLSAGRISEVVRCSTPEDFQLIERDGEQIFLIKLRNEKNRKRKIKRIPIDYLQEKKLVNIIYNYTKDIPIGEWLFNVSRFQAHKYITRFLGFNPHWIRHLRLSHLSLDYGMGDQLLKRYAGWTDTRPASEYIETRWIDLFHKMKEGREK